MYQKPPDFLERLDQARLASGAERSTSFDIALGYARHLDDADRQIDAVYAQYSRDTGTAAEKLSLALANIDCVLKYLDRVGLRIKDTGPFIQPTGREGDLSSLIADARAAALHPDSRLNSHSDEAIANALQKMEALGLPVPQPPYTGQVRFWFMGPGESNFIGRAYENRSRDDILVAFGRIDLYLRENLRRAWSIAYDRLIEAVGRGLHHPTS